MKNSEFYNLLATYYDAMINFESYLNNKIEYLRDYISPWQFLFVLAVPLVAQNGFAVARRPPNDLDPLLKQMSLTALLFAIIFGVGQLLA